MNTPVALAVAAGMVGAINPCGFSLLPAYVSLFVAGEVSDSSLDQRLVRAGVSSVSVIIGFLGVFVTLGVLLDSVLRSARQSLPWFTMAIGVLIVGAGLATIGGKRLSIPYAPLRASSGRGPVAMMAYGVVYAIASLSCTLGPFLAVTSTALDQSTASGLVTFAGYAIGMGTIITILAAGAAFARPGASRVLRRMSRLSSRIGGVVMVASGAYAIWYSRWELAVYHGNLNRDSIVQLGERVRADTVALIERLDPVAIVAIVVLSFGFVLAYKRSSHTERTSGDA